MDTRERIRESLAKNLIGPRGGLEEVIEGRVHLNYMMGVLYARGTEAKDLQIEETAPTGEKAENDEEGSGGKMDADLGLENSLLPSAAGLTFCTDGNSDIKVRVSAGVYEALEIEVNHGSIAASDSGKTLAKGGKASSSIADAKTKKGDTGVLDGSSKGRKSKNWKRRQLDQEITLIKGKASKTMVFGGRASVRSRWRKAAGGDWIVTLSLVNERTRKSKIDPSLDLFQVGMEAYPLEGVFPPYKVSSAKSMDPEAREIAFNLREKRPFAVGHGASATWRIEGKGASSVALDFLPAEHVARPSFTEVKVGDRALENTDFLGLSWLASGHGDRQVLVSELRKFVAFYQDWLDSLVSTDDEYEDVIDRRRSRIGEAISRMSKSIELLDESASDKVYKAFTLANSVMLMSMVMGNRRKPGPYELGAADTSLPDHLAQIQFRWRPFQLAYLLLVIESLVNEDSKWRDTVDLIWFSTGGGKTEAYLLVSAFEMIFRRLKHGKEGGGTAVINRYTYRFLTADQFDRTSSLACALELIRRQQSGTLGDEPFTVGLWVGQSLTPNSYKDAEEGLENLIDSLDGEGVKNTFQVESCPFCGTRLFPSERKKDGLGNDDFSHYGFKAANASFKCFCPDPKCEFHEKLPLSMVDEDLYRHPPTFLIATIDKFAMLAWKEKAGVFLGTTKGRRPPSLIIQDELHLISGPLGTLAGLYEAGIEAAIRANGDFQAGPKFVSSTATIRNAEGQCKRLYGRETRIFPSPGLSEDDSFFSRMDYTHERSRLYIGVMGQGIRNTVAVYWSIAAILQAVHELEMTDEEKDAYWTLLAYHNSKRELGRTRNALSDEIADRIKVYCEVKEDRRAINEVVEISSNAVESVSTARAALSRGHAPPSNAIDVVPCTNMISVGIDVDRLGIMFVNGQPKLTSEYIQATSRVGRRQVPGLVITSLSAAKPRDLSHYESFRYFHSMMNNLVEPTSVTPGAGPAIQRALHAAMVIAIRYGTGLSKNQAAAKLDLDSPEFEKINDFLRKRLASAYSKDRSEREVLDAALTDKFSQWQDWAAGGHNLCYVAGDKNSEGLLLQFGGPMRRVGWPTLMSMRHVDSEVDLELI